MSIKNIKRICIIFFLGFFIILGATQVTSAISSIYVNDRSLYFVQLINYSLPVAKITSFNPEDLSEKNKSVKEKLWNVIGVDINSTVTLLGKEISLLNTKSIEVNVSKVEELNPFKLNKENILSETVDDNSSKIEANVITPTSLDPDKPVVLIYHSHTTESYMPTKNNSTDETMNVCAVGDVIESELEKTYGISTIHDKTIHDALGDIDAYARSRVTVNKYLKQYGSFRLIMDIHRDSSSNKKNDTVVFNKETLSKCMFVMCQEGPYADKNMLIANKMTSIANSLYPQLFKNVYTEYHKGTLYFNQDLSSNSVLIEVGTNLTSVAEAKASSKYLAKIISEYLKSK